MTMTYHIRELLPLLVLSIYLHSLSAGVLDDLMRNVTDCYWTNDMCKDAITRNSTIWQDLFQQKCYSYTNIDDGTLEVGACNPEKMPTTQYRYLCKVKGYDHKNASCIEIMENGYCNNKNQSIIEGENKCNCTPVSITTLLPRLFTQQSTTTTVNVGNQSDSDKNGGDSSWAIWTTALMCSFLLIAVAFAIVAVILYKKWHQEKMTKETLQGELNQEKTEKTQLQERLDDAERRLQENVGLVASLASGTVDSSAPLNVVDPAVDAHSDQNGGLPYVAINMESALDDGVPLTNASTSSVPGIHREELSSASDEATVEHNAEQQFVGSIESMPTLISPSDCGGVSKDEVTPEHGNTTANIDSPSGSADSEADEHDRLLSTSSRSPNLRPSISVEEQNNGAPSAPAAKNKRKRRVSEHVDDSDDKRQTTGEAGPDILDTGQTTPTATSVM